MKIFIIGGGPAGMLSAIAASKDNKNKVILCEKNEKLGKKLFITGKGRCNVTNAAPSTEFYKNIVHNSKFLFSAFNVFSNEDFMNLLKDSGLKIKIERGNRVFPESDKSFFVTDTLKEIMRNQGVKVNLNTELIGFKKEDEFFLTLRDKKTNKEYIEMCDKLIIATGGFSYQSTGSTGDGYKFAKEFNIDVTPIKPALVPLNIKEIYDCEKLQNLTLKNVAISIYNSNDGEIDSKAIYKDFGEMLFTDFGVSGPIILSASSFIDFKENKSDITKSLSSIKKSRDEKLLFIDLKPALTSEVLDKRLRREFEINNKLKEVLRTLLPTDMLDIFLERLNQNVNDKFDDIENLRTSDIDKNLRKEIVKLLKNFRFTITGKRGFDEAIITSGGVNVKELNPKTMESKKVKGLYFVGEVLDVDCLTGGFNIQVAASTGYAAGKSLQI